MLNSAAYLPENTCFPAVSGTFRQGNEPIQRALSLGSRSTPIRICGTPVYRVVTLEYISIAFFSSVMSSMRGISLLFLSAVLCCFLANAAAEWDDTVAPLTVVAPTGSGTTSFDFHMAHYGQVPYGMLVSGCACPMLYPTCSKQPAPTRAQCTFSKHYYCCFVCQRRLPHDRVVRATLEVTLSRAKQTKA